MQSCLIEILNPSGLHTRPGNLLVKKAKEYASSITLTKGEKQANAKSMISLMKIGISQGDMITIEANGVDEAEAIDGLTILIKSLKE